MNKLLWVKMISSFWLSVGGFLQKEQNLYISPNLELRLLLTYILALAFPGATSLKSYTLASPRLLLYTVMKPPPPMPAECILMIPIQNRAAMAESTADPFFLRISRPTIEQGAASAATTP